MKINVLKRCEDSSLIILPAKKQKEADKLAEVLAKRPGVVGCRFRGMAGTDKAIFNIVHKLGKGPADVPAEVAATLIELKLAEPAKAEKAAEASA